MEKLIEFTQARKLEAYSADYSQINDSYLFSHITPGSTGTLFANKEPMKLNGMIFLLIRQGSVSLDINLDSYHIGADMIAVLQPGTLVQPYSDSLADVDAYLLFFDVKFLRAVNINLTTLALPDMAKRPKPVQQLYHDESDVMSRYFELLHLNTRDNTNPQFNRNIATALIAAMCYQLVQFYHKRIGPFAGDRPLSRRHSYVRDFIRLVHVHYVRERSVAFYADKLYISPKYLSLLVKEATGKSAAHWIDEFVVMEAKNMLRFSSKNVQQVAYSLNFPSQSSFGKYFKHLTGMSPTEYQKS